MNNKRQLQLEKLGYIFIATGFTLMLILILFYTPLNFKYPFDINKLGSYGQLVSGISGTILSLAGIIILISTLIETRKISEKQQFETAFFNLLNNQLNIINNIRGKIDWNSDEILKNSNGVIPHDDAEYSGQIFFAKAVKAINTYFNHNFTSTENAIKKNFSPKDEKNPVLIDFHKNLAIKAYNDFFSKHVSQLGHYFRHLYNILVFIENRAPGDKTFYFNIVQANMSSDELALVFYNGIGKFGKNFFEIIEKYNFLQNMEESKLIEYKIHKHFYPKSKFRFMMD